MQAAPQPQRPQPGVASASPAPLVPVPLGEAWSQTVNQMVAAEAVAALTRELGLQSELRSQAEGLWTLRVERESLNQTSAREKLQAALQAALQDSGEAPKLVVELGPVADSPARRNAAAAQERQRQAEDTIHNDPFVQEMMRDWGAKIVPNSIKPRAPASARPA